MSAYGVQLGGGVSMGAGIELGIPPVLKLSLDASTYTTLTTTAAQSYSSGSSMTTFRVLNRGGNWDEMFASWTTGTWSCTQFPGSVVTNMTNPGDDSPIITITGGTFVSGQFYSFTSSGVWFDSVNNLPFGLYNGVTYDSSNGGSMVFVSASSQYAQCSTSLSTLNTWTVEAWHYYDGTNVGGSPCIVTEVFPGTTSSINYALGSLNDNSPNLQSGFYRGGWTQTPAGYVLTTENWYQLVGTYDGQSSKLYVNNILVESALGSALPLSSNGGINLMKRWDYTEFWGGKLAIIKIYDGAINARIVAASWNANKARFGLS